VSSFVRVSLAHCTNSSSAPARIIENLFRFVANCRRREVCESELREEQGLGPRETVSVPAPGVPRVDVNLDDLLLDSGGSDEQDEGSNGGGGDYFDDYFGTDENDQTTK